jgi:hypothetical protein
VPYPAPVLEIHRRNFQVTLRNLVLDGRKFEQELSDYREIDGVKFPFTIKMMVDGMLQSQISVQSVEFNVKIDDTMFKVVK